MSSKPGFLIRAWTFLEGSGSVGLQFRLIALTLDLICLPKHVKLSLGCYRISAEVIVASRSKSVIALRFRDTGHIKLDHSPIYQ